MNPYLDHNTESSSAPSRTSFSTPSEVSDVINLETGEVLFSYDRFAKWKLQSTIRYILGYEHRVNFCHRYLSYNSSYIKVLGSEEHKPYYAGLMTCGLIWPCPICAAKIQAVRALEVRQAINTFLESGGSVLDDYSN